MVTGTSARFWVGICGPMEIRCGSDDPCTVPQGQRALLGLLAAVGSTVGTDTIVAALWPRKPPPSAVGIVQTYISKLRFLLGRDGERVIVRDGVGYRLIATGQELDLLAFRELVAQARLAQRLETARVLYERAMSLWRGRPLSDIEALRDHPTVVAVAEERLRAMLEYAELASENGWHEEVLPHLRNLAAENRLDEKVHAALMVALAGNGRQAEALGLYEEIRRLLDVELGMPPGSELRDAHARVLRQEVVVADVGGSWRAVRQLPAAVADFIGRRTELETLIGAVTAEDGHPGVPVVVLCGQPGVGKTALALYAAHTVSGFFPDGQMWVQLAGSSSPRSVGDAAEEMLRALGVPGSAIPEEVAQRAALLRSRLAGRRVLVVADDAASAAQVEPLLPGTRGCALIVTSRTHVEGLSGARLIPLDVLSPGDSVQLLGRMLGEDRVASNPEAAAMLAEACGYLPLALRVSGGKLAARSSWPLSVMVRRLTEGGSRLSELDGGTLSVRASIASSYDSLPQRHQLVFRCLAFLGPCDFPGWVATALLGELRSEGVLDDLVRQSLLVPVGVDGTGEPRYRMHDLLRDFAAERLSADGAGASAEAIERLLLAWLQLVCLADARLPREPYFPPLAAELPDVQVIPGALAEKLTADAVAWFTAERGCLLIAVEQACRSGRADIGWQIAAHHGSFHVLQIRLDDTEFMWRCVSAHADDKAVRGWARLRVAASRKERGHAADALPALNECAEQAEDMGDHELLAFVMYWRSACVWDVGEYGQARADAERGVAAARIAGSRLGEMLNLRLLASAFGALGLGDEAISAGQQALAIATQLGGKSYELAALHNLGWAYTAAGQHDLAIEVCTRRLVLSLELDDTLGQATSYGVLGDACYRQGEYELALRRFLSALAIFETHQARGYTALCLFKLGQVYVSMQRYTEAVPFLTEAMAVFGELELKRKWADARDLLARCVTPEGREVTMVRGDADSGGQDR
jgi:DNA-binding SARP family transcriptional activator/tetratricopeptide (TPR) repeat protein